MKLINFEPSLHRDRTRENYPAWKHRFFGISMKPKRSWLMCHWTPVLLPTKTNHLLHKQGHVSQKATKSSNNILSLSHYNPSVFFSTLSQRRLSSDLNCGPFRLHRRFWHHCHFRRSPTCSSSKKWNLSHLTNRWLCFSAHTCFHYTCIRRLFHFPFQRISSHDHQILLQHVHWLYHRDYLSWLFESNGNCIHMYFSQVLHRKHEPFQKHQRSKLSCLFRWCQQL